jgi:hypothetical protein
MFSDLRIKGSSVWYTQWIIKQLLVLRSEGWVSEYTSPLMVGVILLGEKIVDWHC